MKPAAGEVDAQHDEHEHEGDDSEYFYPAWGSLIVNFGVRIINGIGFARIRICVTICVHWHPLSQTLERYAES